MIRRPPRATRITHSCPTRRSSDLVTLVHPLLLESVRGRVVVRPFDPPTPFDFLLCRPREARNMALVDAFVEETRKTAAEIARDLISEIGRASGRERVCQYV